MVKINKNVKENRNMSNETIKKAIDNFENDDYIGAEDALKKEIKRAKNDYMKKHLELENDVEEIEAEEEEDKTTSDDPNKDTSTDDDDD